MKVRRVPRHGRAHCRYRGKRHVLALATAKPIESAVQVLERAGLIGHFDFVSGSVLDLLSQGKPSVIAHAIAGLGVDPTKISAVMIGDRKDDILGAHHHGFEGIGVLWEYADPGELAGVGADHVVGSIDDIRRIIGLAQSVSGRGPSRRRLPTCPASSCARAPPR